MQEAPACPPWGAFCEPCRASAYPNGKPLIVLPAAEEAHKAGSVTRCGQLPAQLQRCEESRRWVLAAILATGQYLQVRGEAVSMGEEV